MSGEMPKSLVPAYKGTLTFPFPSMHSSSPSHAAHDLIEDEQHAMLVTYSPDGLEVSGHGRQIPGSGSPNC
jgi:hypothetical protein